jgi:hypothetical protein
LTASRPATHAPRRPGRSVQRRVISAGSMQSRTTPPVHAAAACGRQGGGGAPPAARSSRSLGRLASGLRPPAPASYLARPLQSRQVAMHWGLGLVAAFLSRVSSRVRARRTCPRGTGRSRPLAPSDPRLGCGLGLASVASCVRTRTDFEAPKATSRPRMEYVTEDARSTWSSIVADGTELHRCRHQVRTRTVSQRNLKFDSIFGTMG